MADQETRTKWTAVCLGTFLCVSTLCHGFNFDPRFAIIKKGNASDYFGYSVTQHQIVDESTGLVLENLILVGAPKHKVSPTFGGAIYRCDATSTSALCDRLQGQDFDGRSADVSISATDQWLGVTLQSLGKGKKVVTCAHRYIMNNAALGNCLLMNQKLNDVTQYSPCRGWPHTNFLEDFGLCQAGFSAALGPEDSLSIGAPGSVIWIGTVFGYNVTDELGVDKGPFISPLQGVAPPTNKYSYLGYSVAIGKFDAKNLYSVTGAPRSNERGEIVFLHRPTNNNNLIYQLEHKILGEKDFSGFGSSLLVIDLNNDGFDDLIVGAPFYYDKRVGGAIYIFYGSTRMIDNKSIFTRIVSRDLGPQDCEALGCEHARFGASLARLGDVNNDGYEDFAVGAPYEGKGAVYIYHGSKEGVEKRYSQRIYAEEMPGGADLLSFGSSLAGGLDLDANGYPDLAVGSYEAGTVAVLRSRPIAHLIPEISVVPNITDLEAKAWCSWDNTSHRCVRLTICLRFTAEPAASFTGQPIISYLIEAEKTRPFSRLELVGSTDATKKTFSGEIRLFPQITQKKNCTHHIAYLKDSFADKLNPMNLTVKFSQIEASYVRPQPGQPLVNINSYPILATRGVAAGAEPNAVSVSVDFVKQCGEDNRCDSDLQFKAILNLEQGTDNVYIMKDGANSKAEITFNVTNVGEAAYLTQVYIQKPPNVDYQGVSGTGQEKEVKCLPAEEDDTLIICDDIGNPLKTSQMVTFKVKLANRLSFTDQPLNITAWVNTSSTEKSLANDKAVFHFRVIREADLVLSVNVRPDDQILCSGEPRGTSAIKTEEDIGPAVNHTYIVANNGPSDVSRATLTIDWPLADRTGKYLLYLMTQPIIEKGSARCSINGTVNPANIALIVPEAAPVKVDSIQPLDNQGKRRKRESSNLRVRRAKRSGTILGCKQETAKCIKINCELQNLQRNQYISITLRARLWESTLMQDYRTAGDLMINSYGSVKIDPSLKIEQKPTDNDEKEASTVAVPDIKDVGTKPVQWWWILLAVLGGILLLTLIIFILYKCGFFRRKRPEEMQMYQAEKKNQRMLEEEEQDDK